MTQEEVLFKTVIEKNKEIEKLKKLITSGANILGKGSKLEKTLWATLFAVCDKYVKCSKCGSGCKPITTKTNYMVLCCQECGNIFSAAKKGKPVYSAYFTKSGGRRDA